MGIDGRFGGVEHDFDDWTADARVGEAPPGPDLRDACALCGETDTERETSADGQRCVDRAMCDQTRHDGGASWQAIHERRTSAPARC